MYVRKNNRAYDAIRPTSFTLDYLRPNTVLIEQGETKIICYPSYEERVPQWLLRSGQGWLNAEYNLLPGSTDTRTNRDRGNNINSRTLEIQRLIGRSLRAAMDLKKIPQMTLRVDCDVIKADGGTRCAAITGSYLALHLLCKRMGSSINPAVLKQPVAGISVGLVEDNLLLDLQYEEDVIAGTDMNLIMLRDGHFVEIQGTAEHGSFTKNELQDLISIGEKGITQVFRAVSHELEKINQFK